MTSSARTGYWLPLQAWPERTIVAKTSLQELRRAQPNISLDWIAHQMPIKQDSDRDHYLEGFRRAGME